MEGGLLVAGGGISGVCAAAEVQFNCQRQRRHELEPLGVQSLLMEIQPTNGADRAGIFEMRCYG